MLLIVISQILFWILIGLFVITIALSAKGILSPKFTLLLFAFLGGGVFLNSFRSASGAELPIVTKPLTLIGDTSQTNSILQDEGADNIIPEPLEEALTSEDEGDTFENQEITGIETVDTSTTENLIPQEYEVHDTKLRTYQTKGSWMLGKPFITYFEEKTGWKKTKKGNYEIEISHSGKFTQMPSEDERLYVYSGGQVEIKVNGNLCCCSTVFSIPSGLSDSKLVKAQEKLGQTISDFIFKNKQQVLVKIQKCL